MKNYKWPNKTILLVEDDDVNIKLIDRILSITDVNILIAKNNEEAIDVFSNNKVDLILMDVSLPITNGIEIMNNIYKIKDDANVIFLTAMHPRSILPIREDAGYIEKPFDYITFYRTIDLKLRGKK